MRVADYKNLRVYSLAFESAMRIFELSQTWPAAEKFSLTDQIRRSSRSVCTNLAEAWRKRRYEAAFVSKLSDSDGEAAETEVHLDFALRCRYLSNDNHAMLRDRYDHICRQLTKMMGEAGAWCGSGAGLHENPSEYFVGASEREERPSVESIELVKSVENVGSVESVESVKAYALKLAKNAPTLQRSNAPDAPDAP